MRSWTQLREALGRLMEVGLALPTMARGYDRSTTVDWCRGIDAGPFSSVSCGERITYHNQEMLVTNAAAAALTERVRVFVNLVVGPLHRTAVLAKQLATLDVLAGGRLTVGLGVGGREERLPGGRVAVHPAPRPARRAGRRPPALLVGRAADRPELRRSAPPRSSPAARRCWPVRWGRRRWPGRRRGPRA